MITLAWVLGIIIFGFVLAVLFGRAARLGAEQEVPPPPTFKAMSDHLAQMEAAQDAVRVKRIAELQERLADNRAILQQLYRTPADLQIIGERSKVYCEIIDDERALHALRHGRVLPESYDWL